MTGAYELIHARLGHPRLKMMAELPKHVDGLPIMKPPPLFKCDTCLKMKATKCAMTEKAVKEALQQHTAETAVTATVNINANT